MYVNTDSVTHNNTAVHLSLEQVAFLSKAKCNRARSSGSWIPGPQVLGPWPLDPWSLGPGCGVYSLSLYQKAIYFVLQVTQESVSLLQVT